MASLSLFPMFMNPLGGGGGGGDGLLLELQAEPDVFLEPEIQVTVDDTAIDVVVDDDIAMEVD